MEPVNSQRTESVERAGGGAWHVNFDGHTRVAEVSFRTDNTTLMKIDRFGVPENFSDASRMLFERIHHLENGYFPTPYPTPSGLNAWIWNCFSNEIKLISEREVLASVPLGDLYGPREIRSLRKLSETTLLVTLGLHGSDDYGDELVAALEVSLPIDGFGFGYRVQVFEERYWHGQAPPLESFDEKTLF
jgi:hypothetical protein